MQTTRTLMPMIALLVYAAISDARARRIPNWLNFTLILSGVAHSFLLRDAITPLQSVEGFGIGFAIAFAMFVLGALKGGDVKLLAGIGAWLGPIATIKILILEKLFGLAIVLWQSRRRLPELFRNTAVLALNISQVTELGVDHVQSVGKAFRSIDRPLPYAVPVLCATLVVLLGMI